MPCIRTRISVEGRYQCGIVSPETPPIALPTDRNGPLSTTCLGARRLVRTAKVQKELVR